MTYTEPVILKECFPLLHVDDMIDDGLKTVYQMWHETAAQTGGVPVWNMDFGMRLPSIMSRTMLYDTSGDDIFISLIGETCREFIGLEKAKGALADLIPEINAKDIRHRIGMAMEQRAPNYCLKSMSWNENRDFIKYEALFLPFVVRGKRKPSWFFTAMAFHEEV